MGLILRSFGERFVEEMRPPRDLNPWIERVWICDPGPRSLRSTVLIAPDPRTELILRVNQQEAVGAVGGPTSRQRIVPNDGRSFFVGLTIRSHAARALLGCDTWQLADETVDPRELAPREWELLEPCRASDRAGWLATLMGFVRRRISRAHGPDPVAAHAVARLSAAPPPPVRDVAKELGVTDRHLRRRLRDVVGLTPRQITRISRLHRALGRALTESPTCLATLALDAGYCDQSHMNREFRRLLGMTPLQLTRHRSVSSKTRADSAG